MLNKLSLAAWFILAIPLLAAVFVWTFLALGVLTIGRVLGSKWAIKKSQELK